MPDTTVTAADLAAWSEHTSRLNAIARFLTQAAADSPCSCGSCTHCKDLGRLAFEVKTTADNAKERLAWLENRIRQPSE